MGIPTFRGVYISESDLGFVNIIAFTDDSLPRGLPLD
jgi:hypothetical protein